MSTQKLEKVLELFLNEETEAASQLLSDYIVEKSRELHEQIMSEDEKEDFIDDITAGEDEITADEEFASNDGMGGEEGELEAGEVAEETIENEVDQLRAELEELKRELEIIKADELEEPEHADIEDELKEATQFSKDVSVDMKGEGRLAGNGKNVKVNTKSTVATSKMDTQAKAAQFSKKGSEGNRGNVTATKSGLPGVDVVSKDETAPDMSKEGKLVGDAGTANVYTKSVLKSAE
jgi:paraquat-inducible protein B